MAAEPKLPPGQYLDLPGHDPLFVRDVPGPADAPAVVLLHGWTVTADLNWYPAYEPLSERYRVVAFDMRGHGRGIRSRRRFRLTDCADDVVGVADALGIDRFVVVGYSLGGALAQVLADRHPSRVDGAVFCATTQRFRGRGMARARMAMLPAVGTVSRVAPDTLRSGIFEWALDRMTRQRDLGDWVMGELASCDPQALLDAGTSLYTFDSTAWVGRLRQPSAVVLTQRDGVVLPARQCELFEALPSATLHLAQGTHTVCVTNPGAFLPPLGDALESVTGRLAEHTDQLSA